MSFSNSDENKKGLFTEINITGYILGIVNNNDGYSALFSIGR